MLFLLLEIGFPVQFAIQVYPWIADLFDQLDRLIIDDHWVVSVDTGCKVYSYDKFKAEKSETNEIYYDTMTVLYNSEEF